MDIDTILRAEKGDKEEYSEDSAAEEPEALLFMEPDHEEVRTKKRSRGTKVLGVGTHDRNHQHSEDRECRSLPEVLLTLQSQGTHQSKLPRKKKTGSSAMDKEARAPREEDHSTKGIRNRKRTREKIHKQTQHCEEAIHWSSNREHTSSPTVRRGVLVRANLVNIQDMGSAPSKPTNTYRDKNTKRNRQNTTNTSRISKTKQASLQQEGTLGTSPHFKYL